MSSDDIDSGADTVRPNTLYVVATPIGNLGDLSPRALNTLATVDLVAAEDTRTTGRMLARLGVRRDITAFHDHNERQQAARLIDELIAGRSVALVSDAGTPLVSDPGYRLVDAAHENGLSVVSIPGPSAVIAALSVSGQASDRFCFEGFLPARSGARQRTLGDLVTEQRTMVFFESTHRIADSIADFRTVFGDARGISVARELTKRYETVFRGSLGEAWDWIMDRPAHRRGEFVLVLAGAQAADATDTMDFDHVLQATMAYLPLSQAVDLSTQLTGENRNRIYRRALELKQAGATTEPT